MSADFSVIDPTLATLVTPSMPYVRFAILGPISATGGVMLTMAVKTFYSDIGTEAAVLLSGNRIGTIDPRPWVNHDQIDMEMISFWVPESNLTLLPLGLGSGVALGFLEVVPVDEANAVFVGNVVIQFHNP